MSLAEALNDQGASARALYEKLEDRVLARDQVGASECYYGLVRDGRALPEMLREAVRIHGPYTHVPYHERIDNGFVNFVNNDHCLLSARATLHPKRSTRHPATTPVAWHPRRAHRRSPSYTGRTKSRSVSTGRCATASTNG